MVTYLLALGLGVVAGMRTMMAPTAASWAAYLGWLDLSGTWLAFLGSIWTSVIFTALALLELITDQLPGTPSRTIPPAFAARILSGGLSGAALGASAGSTGSMFAGLLCGIVGAVIGTLGGRAFRGRLAQAFGQDRPAAFLEDAVAIVAAALIVVALR
ncbi:MAG: DUF4126 family protein [Planctomycetota bacterium]|nr:MAG: DUF4126 family protein [Planctomycetota bacterium]